MKKGKENPALFHMTWIFYLISQYILTKTLILERRLCPFTYKMIVYVKICKESTKKAPPTNKWVYQGHRIQDQHFKNQSY